MFQHHLTWFRSRCSYQDFSEQEIVSGSMHAFFFCKGNVESLVSLDLILTRQAHLVYCSGPLAEDNLHCNLCSIQL